MKRLCANLPLAMAVAFLSSPSAAHAGPAPAKSSNKFKITTRRTDDNVQVVAEQDRTLFVVRSPFGISRATIERMDDRWPRMVAVRLHLQGLSNFRVSGGSVRLDAVVSVDKGERSVRVWKDGNEDASVDPKSPLWLEFRVIGSDGKPAAQLPLKDGYFEVTLPRALLESNPTAITLSWIDFYR